MTERMARKEKDDKPDEAGTLRIERTDALDAESDIYSMLQFNTNFARIEGDLQEIYSTTGCPSSGEIILV